MAYTTKQLTMAWAAVHVGAAPDATTLADIQNKAAQNGAGVLTDAQALSWVLNSADNSTALAALSYQFFTGKSPSKDGMAFLVNSPTNPNDLNDAYYARFNLENRYINFAANLGVQGEGKDAFATKYGAMSFASYIASIYESIIGKTYAQAAGIDPAAAIAYLVSRQDAILATAKSAGMITPGMSQAQIDLAVKAAAAGFLMGEAIKADVGLYAAAANNFMLALARGDAVYNVDLTTAYKPTAGQGAGQSVTTAPSTDTLPGYVAPPPPPPPPPPQTVFTLSAGANTLSGTNLADSFNATGATLDASDVINGGGGNDTLTVTVTTSPYTLPTPTVSGLENLVVNSTGAVTANTTGWTDLTQLTMNAVGQIAATASSTTNITATSTSQGSASATVNGGHDVTLTTTGATTGTITVSGQPTGAVVISRETTGAVVGGLIGVSGGKTIDITQIAANAVNTTQTLGAIQILGGAQTTSVKIKATPAAVADASHAGVIGGDVTIADVNYGSAAPGTITSIDIDGAEDISILGNAVDTLKVSHVTGGIGIFYFGGGAPVSDTLNMTLNAVDAASFNTINLYTKLNVTTGSQASSLSSADFGNITTLTIDGSSPLTVNSVTAGSLQTVTTSGAGGLKANLSGLANLTLVDTSASTGASTLTINPSKTTFTGGAGGDTVTLSGTNITKAIDLGAGNDTLILANGTGVPGVAINGGAGTADTLQMIYTDIVAVGGSSAFANQVTGFERLTIVGGNNVTVDVAELGGYHYVTTRSNTGLTIKGLSSGDTVELKEFSTFTGVDGANFGGANDSLNVRLTDAGGQTYGRLGSTGIENIALTIVDTADVVGTHNWRGADLSLKTLTITGNAPAQIFLHSTILTSVDASALTGGGLTLSTLGAVTTATTIKGSATGDNTINFDLATGAVTYIGGSGADIISVGDAANVINVGTGTDRVNVTNANIASDTIFTTITGLGAGDELSIAAQVGASLMTGVLGAAITVGGTPTLADYLNAAAAGDGSGTSIMTWFQFGGATYVVLDSHQDGVFTTNYDIVVKLTGAISLNGAAVNNGVLTL